MEPITQTQILEFLRKVGIMSVAINADPYPISSILLFAVDDDFTLYFATHANTKKAKALEAHPKLSYSVWKEHEMLIQASGIVTPVKEDELDTVLNKLAQRAISIEDFWPPVLQFEADEYAVFKIKTVQMQAIPLQFETMSSQNVQVYTINL